MTGKNLGKKQSELWAVGKKRINTITNSNWSNKMIAIFFGSKMKPTPGDPISNPLVLCSVFFLFFFFEGGGNQHFYVLLMDVFQTGQVYCFLGF